MIGKLSINVRGRCVLAILNEDLMWTCEDASYLALLNDLFPAPKLDQAGHISQQDQLLHHLYHAGERLGAQVQVVRGLRPPCTTNNAPVPAV